MVDWLAESKICPGLFYGTPAQDGLLLRLRLPGGRLRSQQGRTLVQVLTELTAAEPAETVFLQVTNRANLQLRGVTQSPSAQAFAALQGCGLAAQNPALDFLRNLLVSPTAGIDRQELIDVRSLLQALDQSLQAQPPLAGLPAKFSIGLDGGGAVGLGQRSAAAWEHRYSEIQLSAVRVMAAQAAAIGRPAGVYFQLALDAGKSLVETAVLLRPDQLVSAVSALMAAYLDYVAAAEGGGKPPRLRQLLADWGVADYLARASRHWGQPLSPLSAALPLSPAVAYAHLGVQPQRQADRVYVGMALPLGRLSLAQLQGLVPLAERWGSGQLRLTPWQGLLLPDVPTAELPGALAELAKLGLMPATAAPNWVDAAIVACAGRPGCAASATATQPHAIALAAHLRQHLTRSQPINIHLSGCEKSCAQPSPAEITLLGTELPGPPGLSTEAYQIYLGPPSGSPLATVRAAEIGPWLERQLRRWPHAAAP